MDLKSKEILKDYESSLEDLTFNSKPIINMLTMLANKHRGLASEIVDLVETRFFKVATLSDILWNTQSLLLGCRLMCMYIYVHLFLFLYVYTCIYLNIGICIHACMYVCIKTIKKITPHKQFDAHLMGVSFFPLMYRCELNISYQLCIWWTRWSKI